MSREARENCLLLGAMAGCDATARIQAIDELAQVLVMLQACGDFQKDVDDDKKETTAIKRLRRV